MKKILIGLLICIPLIIVFAIDVSGDIIATTTDITIEEITLYHDGDLLDDVIEVEINDYINRAYRIEAVTYPSIATKELVWSSSDIGVASVDANGDVTFTGRGFGEVKIFCQSKNNLTIRATATFYVSGSELYSIQIVKQGESEYASSLSMGVGEKMQLTKIVLPAPAIREKKTVWSSSNPGVATIDGNGIVTALSHGTTTIKASVYESNRDEYVESTITLTVNASSQILKKPRLTIAADSVDLSSYAYSTGFDILDVEGDATVDGTILSYTGDTAGEVALKVRKGNNEERLCVKFTKGAYELSFENLDYLVANQWADGAYVNLKNYEFSLVATVLNDDYNGPKPTITYSVSNPTAITLGDDGALYGIGEGSATIVASAVGFANAEIEVSVKIPLEYIAITIDNDEDERGVEGTRIWGNKFAVRVDALGEGYDLSKVTRPTVDFMYGYVNTYKFEVATYRPSTADLTFEYYSTNEDYATVDKDGVITFKEAAIGNQVGVYMVAKYSFGANAARDGYVFNVVDGINLGWEIKETDDCVNLEKLTADPSLVNFDMAMMFAYFMEGWYFEYDRPQNCVDGKQIKKENLILQCDIYYHPDHWEPFALTSLYGNGFKLDGRFKVAANDSFLLKMNRTLGGDIVFQNVILNSATPPSDSGDWSSLKTKGGYIAGIGNQFWEDMDYHYYGYCNCGNDPKCVNWWECPNWKDPYWDLEREYDENGKTKVRETNVTFRYCQVQNTFNSIVVKRGNVLVEGCIFRNTVSAAIMYSPQFANSKTFTDNTSLTVRNCIFASSLAPAIMVTPPFGKVADASMMNVSIEGKNYIYNWQKIKDIDLALLEKGTIENMDSFVDYINSEVNGLFQKVLAREEYDDIKVKNRETGSARSEDYVNLTFCALGLWYDSSKIPLGYDQGQWKNIYADVSDLGGLASMLGRYPIQLLMNYSADETFNTMPGEKYDTASDSEGNPIWMKRLRGEA